MLAAMRLTLLYFAAIRDLMGVSSEEVDLPESARTVRDLAAWIESARPVLAGRLGVVRFAVDERFATLDDVLANGATVALIPPVAGG